MVGFIKYNRSEAAENLECRPNENHLLSIIARRVSRNGNPIKGVKKGEALIGDYEKIGLKRQPYRTALANLVKWGYVTTRVTNRTTYAKLANIEVYDCNILETNHQTNPKLTTKPTNSQPTEQPTSNHNQECKNKEDKNKEEEKYSLIAEFQKIKKGELIAKTQLDNNFHFGIFPEGWTDNFKNEVLGLFRYLEGKEYDPKRWGVQGTISSQIKAISQGLEKYSEQEMINGFDLCMQASKKSWHFYIDKAIEKQDNFIDTSNYTPAYKIPTFQNQNQRYFYFMSRFEAYKPYLNERLINTEYRQRALYDKDAEGLCYQLEQQNPDLAKLEVKFTAV